MTIESVRTDVAGRVWQVARAVGDRVERDDVMIVVESMKMEIPVLAPCAGTVASVRVAVGEDVAESQVIATVDRA